MSDFEEAVERAGTIAGIRRGLEQMKRGEGRPAVEVFAEMKRKFGIFPEQNQGGRGMSGKESDHV